MRVLFEKLTRIIRALQYLLDILPNPFVVEFVVPFIPPCFALLFFFFFAVSDVFLDFSL